MTQKALFFDLDGTLAQSDGPPCRQDVEALRTAQKIGHYIFLCTGRSEGCIYPAITDIGFDGIVAGAGAVVTVNGKTIARRNITRQQMEHFLPLLVQSGQKSVLEGETLMATLHMPQNWGGWLNLEDADSFIEHYEEHIITKFTLYPPFDSHVREEMEKQLDIIDHGHYLEMLPKGCCKSEGMRRALEELRIPVCDSIAFGDSFNDLDMLCAAGIGVAMGSSPEEIKQKADAVTDSVQNAGVSRWLSANLLNAQSI